MKTKLKNILQTIKDGLWTKRENTNIEEEIFSMIDVNSKTLDMFDSYAKTEEVDDFEEFDETIPYSSGDIVRKDGKLYKFTADKQGGAWEPTKVTQTNVLSLADKIFVATYGTTTYAELLAAYNAGKVLVCFHGTSLYVLSLVKTDGTDAQNYFRFGRVLAQGTFSVRGLNCSGTSTWTSKEYLKGVTSVTASSTDDEIPTAKAVWDLLNSFAQKNNLQMPD